MAAKFKGRANVIINRAKGKGGGGRSNVIQCGICYGSVAIKGGGG